MTEYTSTEYQIKSSWKHHRCQRQHLSWGTRINHVKHSGWTFSNRICKNSTLKSPQMSHAGFTTENKAPPASALRYVTYDYRFWKTHACLRALHCREKQKSQGLQWMQPLMWDCANVLDSPGVAAKVVFHQDESLRRSARHFLLFVKGGMRARWRLFSHPPVSCRAVLTTGEGFEAITSHLKKKAEKNQLDSHWFLFMHLSNMIWAHNVHSLQPEGVCLNGCLCVFDCRTWISNFARTFLFYLHEC